jgi:uncharacterized protein (TIGR03437 family)
MISTDVPAPLALGPFRASLLQTAFPDPIAVPLLSAAPVEVCSGLQSCANYTAITIQVPFELFPSARSPRLPANQASLTVYEDDRAGEPVPLNVASDQIHIVGSCDSTLSAIAQPCLPDIRHSDGSYVSSANPAAPGENLTLLAYGLGLGVSAVATGSGAPSPAVEVDGVVMDFRFGTDVAAAPPRADAGGVTAELMPGAIGVYRVLLTVPPLPEGTPPCGTATNLTISLGRAQSFDSAGICVK